MSKLLVTGSLGLVGSYAVKHFTDRFDIIVGIDNDKRGDFFGTEGGFKDIPQMDKYHHEIEDIRTFDLSLLKGCNLVIHCAAQPSHDWATNNVMEDFEINALASVRLLEGIRKYCPDAVVIFCSTNKVYGDWPNQLNYIDTGKRYDYPTFGEKGFDEMTWIDDKLHSFFGCSKASADLYFQEYGKHLGIKTGIFRAGCITGKGHRGAELHGFLAYLIKCLKEDKEYTIYGYGGKQVRDNIHAFDLVKAFDEFYKAPRAGEVYNIGGGTHSNCSVLEAIDIAERLISGKKLNYKISDRVRTGDHKWWISDVSKFRNDYPNWDYTFTLEEIIKELIDAN